MKFVAISDTHGQHQNLVLPKGDVLIHAGDITRRGKEPKVIDFITWFAAQDFEHKIFIAGNHDFYFEREADEIIANIIPKEIIYLNNSGVTINSVNIWGSPITPWFYDWAFNRHRGEAIQRHWDLIPKNIDILVTHGPVMGILDKTVNGMHAGCEDLLQTVKEIKPAVHICGHIHEGYGVIEKGGVKFINASVVNAKYLMVNAPVVFEL